MADLKPCPNGSPRCGELGVRCHACQEDACCNPSSEQAGAVERLSAIGIDLTDDARTAINQAFLTLSSTPPADPAPTANKHTTVALTVDRPATPQKTDVSDPQLAAGAVERAREETGGAWRWWAGENEDEYRLAGPCLTRDEAVSVAYGSTEPGDTIYLVEAIADDVDDGYGFFEFVETRNRSQLVRENDPEPQPKHLQREVVARIIDPARWKLADHFRDKAENAGRVDLLDRIPAQVNPSLEKADAILAALQPRAVPDEGEVERLRHVIDRDRYAASIVLNNIKMVLTGYDWLSEAGRGQYAYDDDRYQREFGDALDAIRAALGPLAKLAWDKTDCTTDPAKVNAARQAGHDRARDLAAQPGAVAGDVVDNLRKLSVAATQGTWKVFNLLPGAFEVCRSDNYSTGGVCDPHRHEDADFIVAAVNHVRAMLAASPANVERGQ